MDEQRLEGFPLSPQQRRLWRLAEGAPAMPRVQCAVRIEGDLDAARLRAALGHVVERHEILRTGFRRLDGMVLPLQVIGAAPPVVWEEENLTALGPDGQTTALEARLTQDRRAGEASILAWLAALEPRGHCLILSLPALCADRTGLRNLVCEVAALYTEGSELDEPVQYADLAQWQNELLEAEETRPGREFWQRQNLAVALRATLHCELPAAGVEGGLETRSVRRTLAPEAVARMDALCRARELPWPELLLTCWHLLLARWAGGEQVVALACDGRRYRELEEAIGPLVRYLPVACAIDAGRGLCAVVRQVEEAAREARKWQECFEWERVSGGEGEAERAFLPWCFDFETTTEDLHVGGLRLALDSLWDQGERFKLRLSAVRCGDALHIEVHYDVHRFETAEVERLAAQFGILLERLVGSPETPVGEVPSLTSEECRELLIEWNDSATASPAGTLHAMFERRAAEAPERVAAVCGDRQITFGELDRRAARLARRLRRLGVGPEAVVAMGAERSLEMVAGLLGVLKAGGAYAPLEPGQPSARLARLLEEITPPVLLAQESLLAHLPTGGWRVLCLEEALARPGRHELDGGAAGPTAGADTGNLAYVLFTSGSTGRPKGVAVEHRQIVNYVRGAGERLDLPERASYATVSTFAADLGHTMLFPSLCGGGTLYVIPLEQARDSRAMAEVMSARAVDCLKIVPSHLEALVGGEDGERVLPRRRLVLGGEASRLPLLGRLAELAPGCEVFNHYGPTETTVGALTYAAARGRWDSRWGSLPLGRPLPNVRVYVLDALLQPVPCWVPGEVYIGGAGVSRGYLGRPDGTAERFVPDPFGGVPGARLYRTGDLARHLPDEGLEFLGRADHQVKIRGFRIEPGEIETELRRHPAVRETLVLARDDRPGDPRLVAYVVPRAGASLAAEEVRAHLAGRLPDFMVPAAAVVLPALPLTANGKVDRGALPAPGPTVADPAGTTARTPVEELLAGVWSRLLGVESVDVRDNFFHLGGHSLLATQLFSRVRDLFRVEMPLHLIFELPTVGGLAERIEAAMRSGAGVEAPPMVPVERSGEMPLSFAQQRHWFLQQLDPASALYNVRGAVRLAGRLDVAVLERSVREIVARHEVLRTSFPAVAGRPVQRIAPEASFDLPVVDLAGLGDAERHQEAGRLVREQGRRPFDVAQMPLLRITLLRLAGDEHLAVMTMHHIIADAWSMGVLVGELAALYGALVRGEPSPLVPLPIQYSDFSHWQRAWLRGAVLDTHLVYWRRQLAGSPPGLRLPLDFLRPAVPGLRSRRQPLEIPEEVARGLKALGRESGATLFQVLLAAFQVLLHGYTGQTDIVVGAPIANRNRSETEGLIGCFINALALRADLGGEPTFRELLARVRGMVLDAYMHQDLPFEKLVEELNPDRGASHAPLFQVVFSFGNAPRPPVTLPGLELSSVSTESDLDAKYDLILLMSEGPDGLRGTLTYDRDLFRASTVAGMATRFATLLRTVASHPDARLHELSSGAEQEERRSLVARAEALRQGRRPSLRAGERRAARRA